MHCIDGKLSMFFEERKLSKYIKNLTSITIVAK